MDISVSWTIVRLLREILEAINGLSREVHMCRKSSAPADDK